jgi:four helix bundle protein
MRRCAVSIASNIAEGCSRNNIKEFKQFLAIVAGSAAELKTQLIISREIGFLSQEKSELLIESTDEIERMLTGLSKSLERKPHSQLATRNSQLETTE